MLDVYVGKGRRIYEDRLPNAFLLYVLYYIALSFPFKMLKQMIFLDQGIYIYIYKVVVRTYRPLSELYLLGNVYRLLVEEKKE